MFACSSGVKTYDVIKSDLRAPAYPLITIDPYTSAWAYSDNLYDEVIKHWTGKDFPLMGVAKIDGEFYRFMGTENIPMDVIIPSASEGTWTGRYTFSAKGNDWMLPGYDDSKWLEGEAAFGTSGEPTVRTMWNLRTVNPDVHTLRPVRGSGQNNRPQGELREGRQTVGTPHIWVRRTFDLPEDIRSRKVYLKYSHDDDVIIYVNGIEVVNTGPRTGHDVLVRLEGEALESLKPGQNVISGWCWNTGGGAIIDFGLVAEKEGMALFERTARQTSVDVQAMQTHYSFTCGNVKLNLSFMAPLFLNDLTLVSRPVNYLTYTVEALDGKSHDVELYFEAAPNWALNTPYQPSMSEGFEDGNLKFVRTGSLEQDVLGKRGDDIRIDWGYFYMAADKKNSMTGVGPTETLRSAFVQGSAASLSNERTEQGDYLAIVTDLGKTKAATGKIMLGYDDIYSIQYFEENLRPYWNRNGDQTITGQFHNANRNYKSLVNRAYRFDKELMETATKEGGKKYAELCALAYRQSIHAHKLVQAPNGDLLWLSKENNSNGSIGTVDVTYPSAPLYLYYNPELAKGLLNHIFYYSESGKWTKPFAAHDVGTYPLANGQTYGGDMPVEESGNMVILAAAIAAMEGNAEYAQKHWETLTTWTDYLAEYGLDPENQLCTDDFAGRFPRNVNLSAKAIMGVASYAYLADKLGMEDVSDKYEAKAKEMAQWWMANADNGDHYSLVFDGEGTWSQKYNLVWDKILDYDIFPDEVVEKEIKYYLTKQNEYGLPLDNRRTYTKSDWVIWTATLANDQATFEAFVDPIWKFYNETETRIPMSDWIYTDRPLHSGFKARSVVGGYWIKMLDKKLNPDR